MLDQRILETLRLFNLQGIPVTFFELHKFLIADVTRLQGSLDNEGELVESAPASVTVSMDAMRVVLVEMKTKNLVAEHLGYYCLPGNEGSVHTRMRGYANGIYRERRIRRWVRKARHIPFVDAIGITGSQALGLEKPTSDIDLFIVTKQSRMWTARTLVTAYFQLLGIRRHGELVSNRMCLNHYISGVKEFSFGRNLYTALEYAKIRPIFGTQFFHGLQQANRSWVQTFFTNWRPVSGAGEEKSWVALLFERAYNATFGGKVETMLKDSQQRRIHTSIKFIVVEEDELSFHPNSKQESLLREFFLTH